MKLTYIHWAIGAAILTAGGIYLFAHDSPLSDTQTAAVADILPTSSIVSINPSGTRVTADVIEERQPPPEGYVPYRNETYGILFYHKPESSVKVYDEGAGVVTIVLENLSNPEKARGFQVFIVPYAESKITEERFKMDVPSGVRENVERTTLDGVEAVTFNSYDTFLGKTREIWAIRNGYLYEITTMSGVGRWFTPIIQSWEFL